MKKHFLIICFVFVLQNIFAQKIVNNPDFIINNTSASVTKVELTDTKTILHFYIRKPVGSWIVIPKETYIEDSSDKGKRMYIIKTDGITLTGRNYIKNSDEIRFKLYFPPLPKDVKMINYGESNKGGNWFIYKLNLTKDGEDFLSNQNVLQNLKTSFKVGFPISSITNSNPKNLGINTMSPEKLPKDFFGNWYDKHGTLMLIATPDYLVSDKMIKYYVDIQKIGDNKFKIYTSSNSFEILSLENNKLTIRTNRLISLEKKSSPNKVPKFLLGKWIHWDHIKEITITEDNFYNNDKNYHGTNQGILKNKIDYVATSNNGNLIWFVIYNEGDYFIYFATKKDGEYVLQARGYANARYKKVK